MDYMSSSNSRSPIRPIIGGILRSKSPELTGSIGISGGGRNSGMGDRPPVPGGILRSKSPVYHRRSDNRQTESAYSEKSLNLEGYNDRRNCY